MRLAKHSSDISARLAVEIKAIQSVHDHFRLSSTAAWISSAPGTMGMGSQTASLTSATNSCDVEDIISLSFLDPDIMGCFNAIGKAIARCIGVHYWVVHF